MAAPRTAPPPPHTACLLHIPFSLSTPPLLHPHHRPILPRFDDGVRSGSGEQEDERGGAGYEFICPVAHSVQLIFLQGPGETVIFQGPAKW